jgi:hypothetical protein
MGDNLLTGHGEVLSHMISATALKGFDGGFEHDLLLTLCVPVVGEMRDIQTLFDANTEVL